MSLLEPLTNLFRNLTSPVRHPHHRPDPHPDPDTESRSRSRRPLSSHDTGLRQSVADFEPGDTGYTVPVGFTSTPRSRSGRIQSPKHSYADHGPDHGPDEHRSRRYRERPFGMNRLPGPRHMRTSEHRGQTDEQLLFGNYSSGPGAVRITPGSTFKDRNKKRVQDFASLKPQDTISKKAKESGPVRPRGRPSRTYGGNHFRGDAPGRPAKRQRRGDSSGVGVPAGEDDEVVVVASPPSLSESKSKTEDRRGPIDGRSQNVGVNRSQESKQPKDRSDAEVVQNVEVHVPALKDQFVATDGSRRNSGPRDSPDELQGEVTVNSCPSPVIRTRRTAGDFVPEQSPSDIRPTIFESRRSDPRFDGHKLYFEAKYVQWGDWVVSGEKTIEMSANKAKGTIEVESTDDPDSVVKVPLERITNAQRGKEPNRGVCLRMTRIEGDPCDRMLIEMSTQRDQERFCNVLGQMTKVTEKESKWMANLFEKAKTSKSPLASKRRADKISEQSEPQLEPRVEVKRAKLSASLQDDHGNISQPFTTPRKNPNSTRPTKKNPDPSQKKTDLPGVNIPVKTFTPTQRETRSMHRRPPEPIVCDDENDNDEQPETTPDVNLRKWEKPLVYPRFGKKMAEVDAQDRERLRDNEFLNDNLIGFYIRFLEEHLSRSNKEVAKRVYFFNSYFYATITNNSKGKGINYGGVQKWTRNVNLFNYDYIVVPINEAAHWYVAIICNLPQLQDQPENPTADQESEVQEKADQESEVHGIAETPEPSNSTDQVPKEETARQSLASMSLDDPGSQERDEWPEGEGPITSPARFSQVTTDKAGDKADDKADQKTDSKKQTPAKGKKKKPVPPPQKYDTRQPTIITFDSLDLGRSSTVSILRQYLYEEAKSKQGIEINTKSIKGMRARQVPKQDNFSDCGLYLLAYVEKFVQNPDEFATKLLRREMDEKEDWPELLPGYLRRRLRSFLDELYDEQAEITREKAAERTSMADREPISYLLGSSDLKQSDSPEQEQVEENRPESEQQTGEQLEEQAKEQLESKEGNEIIEVPDSQERGPDTVREEKPGQKDAVPVESDNGENGGGDGDSIIEVQVSGTPTNSEKEKQATSPRAKKE